MKKIPPILMLIICLWYLIVQMMQIEIPIDTGDGLMHYFIANNAIDDPKMYLDHWGKPFFTLLASPFTIFGFKGIVAFNLILFGLTCWIGFLTLHYLRVSFLLQALIPLALIYSFDYVSTILSGLTEILAGFLVVLSGYLLLKKKWMWMAMCMSLLPFCRSEGQLIIVLGLLVLIYNKQFKAIPLLFTAFFVYACIGFFVFGDFFWYLNNDPYPPHSIYGKGDWNHFWNLKTTYLGEIGLLMLIVSMFSIAFLLVKKQCRTLRIDFLLLGFCTFFGILLVHAFFWAYGLKGSLGLTRVITIGLPIVLVCSAYLIHQINVRSKWIQFSFFAATLFLCVYSNQTIFRVPLNNGLDRSVIHAADFIATHKGAHTTVYYHSPLFASKTGINPLAKNPKYKQKSFKGEHEDFSSVRNGDFIVRDSHFGPREMGLPLAAFNNSKEMVLVNEFLPSQPGTSYHGEKWSVKIYQKIPLDKQQAQKHQAEKAIKLNQTRFSIQTNQEFLDISHFTIEEEASSLNMIFQAKQDGGFLNCDINNNSTWSSIPLKKGEPTEIKFPISKYDKIKLYFWNPNKIENTVEINKINLSKISFHPIVLQ